MSYEKSDLLNPNADGTDSLTFKQRVSDSPYVEMVRRGITNADASVTRPAEPNWHLVFSKRNGWRGFGV